MQKSIATAVLLLFCVSSSSVYAFVGGPTRLVPRIVSSRSSDVVKDNTKDEDKAFFDPLNLSETIQPDSNQLLTFTPSSAGEETDNQEQGSGLNLWAARGLLLLVAAIWGTNFASVKYLESLCFHPPCNHPPSEFAFARFGLAAIVSLPLLIGQRRDVILAGFECGMWITMGYMTQALALSTISAGKCAFICSLTVVFVPILALALYGRPIKMSHVVAGMIAMTGVGVLEGMVNLNEVLGIPPAVALDAGTAASSTTVETAVAAGPLASIAATLGIGKGDLLALGQPIGFGYTFLRIEHYQEKYKDVPNRVLTIAAAQCVAVGTLALLWVLSDYHWALPNFGYLTEPHRVAAIGWTGIVTTVVAIFIEGIALQTATASDAALAFSSEPVWASIFGFLLLREQLGINSYVGGAIIMLACLVGSVSDMITDPEKVEHHPVESNDEALNSS